MLAKDYGHEHIKIEKDIKHTQSNTCLIIIIIIIIIILYHLTLSYFVKIKYIHVFNTLLKVIFLFNFMGRFLLVFVSHFKANILES